MHKKMSGGQIRCLFTGLLITIILLGGCSTMEFINQEEAGVYLLEGLREKYGKDFVIAGDETYRTVSSVDVFICTVSPADDAGKTATARVTQFGEATDDYSAWYFKEEAEQMVSAACEGKDYLLSCDILLDTPVTGASWDESSTLEEYLAKSGACVKVDVTLEDELSNEEYADRISDLLDSLYQLDCYLDIRAKANDIYIFSKYKTEEQPNKPDYERIVEIIERDIRMHSIKW